MDRRANTGWTCKHTYNLIGEDIDILRGVTRSECLVACRATDRCSGIVHNAPFTKGIPTCWLKTNTREFKEDHPIFNTTSCVQTQKNSNVDMRPFKIVVNTHRYSTAINTFILSLDSVGFDTFDDVLLMTANCWHAPRKRSFFLLADRAVRAWSIGAGRANFDLHGYRALYEHIHHPAVKADAYMYLHDTITFDYSFTTKVRLFDFDDPLRIYTPQLPAANVAFFGRDVVFKYANSFDAPVSKQDGLLVEFDKGVVNGVRNILHFGNVVVCGTRHFVNANRMYGHARVTLYYPVFGIYKHVKWGAPMGVCDQSNNCTAPSSIQIDREKECPIFDRKPCSGPTWAVC